MKVWGKCKLIKIIKIVFIIILVSLLTSCSGIVPETGINSENNNFIENNLVAENDIKTKTSSVYLDVPYQRYAGKNWCLPASGSMTLDFFGVPISQQELAQRIIKPDGLGDIYKMVRYAKELGFEASFTVLSMEQIEEYISNQIPLIAIQEYKESNPLAHARVIIGFNSDKREIITNDPTIGKNYTMSYEKYMDLNLTANPKYSMAIVISPKLL